MLIKSIELAAKLNVTRGAVSNWIRRGKKIVVNADGFIDTENDLNKAFLYKKAPFLYDNEPIPSNNDKKDAISLGSGEKNEENDNGEIDFDLVNIDDLQESEAKEYLKIISQHNPRNLLYTAQFKKARMEAHLKKLEVEEKLNLIYARDVVHTYFLGLLKLYYENRRLIPYSTVDEIIKLVLSKGADSRGEIISILDTKFLKEIDNTNAQLDHIMNVQFPKGELPESEIFVNVENAA